RPWCYRIATRESFRQLQKQQRWSDMLREQAALDGVEAPPAEAPVEPGLLARLPELLAYVSPSSRAVLTLHYVNGLSLEQAAGGAGAAGGTPKPGLAYGRAALRRPLRDAGES